MTISAPTGKVADLREVLGETIRRSGPLPWADFMEQALYHPELGYYEREGGQIGRRGDFFTSVSVGSLFGELLGLAFAERLERLPGPEPVWLIEAGAHDGQLARDLLNWLARRRPGLWERLRYGILEPSSRRVAVQRRALADWTGKVRWFGSLAELAVQRSSGLLFANELLDALPIRRFVWDAGRRAWRESAVALAKTDDRFVWTRLPAEGPAVGEEDAGLREVLRPTRKLAAVLPDGLVWEHPAMAARWWSEAAEALVAGWLVTLDYGGWTGSGPDPGRPQGTLRAFRGQHQMTDLLADPGEQDLTADVDFALIRRRGEAAGLVTEQATTQGRWLTAVAGRGEVGAGELFEWDAGRRRQFLTLTHPEHLGNRFQVLVQRKGDEGEQV